MFSDGIQSGARSHDIFREAFTNDSLRGAEGYRGYLPASKNEVADIRAVFKNKYGFWDRLSGRRTKVLLEKAASEDQIKSESLKNFRYLHLATHGFVNEDNPELSGLILAHPDASREDGVLYLGEIYNLELNADLVVLSACETGLGQVAKGEGIIDLTRAFLYAGAQNLLVSLWQVNDVTTSELMVAFYRNMLDGMAKPEALRAAKLELMQSNPEYAKPYYWAPFILIGR